MRTISGLYDTVESAGIAVAALKRAGIASADISVVTARRDGNQTAGGIGVGAVIGGAGGLMASLGALAVPGLGPVAGIGWLAATLVGAATGGAVGGLIGAMTNVGIGEDDANVYAESVRRGGTLVTARVDEADADAANEILRTGSVNASARRDALRAEGWSRFDEEDRAFEDDRVFEEGAAREYEDRKDSTATITPFPRA